MYDAYGYRRRDGYIPVPAFVCLSLIAFLSATAALAFSLALWVTAKRRFEADGFEASYGPCVSDLTTWKCGTLRFCALHLRFSRAVIGHLI